MNELRELGLSETQIKKIVARLHASSIPIFISKWKAERSVNREQKNFIDLNTSNNNTTNSTGIPYMPRLLPNVTSKLSSEEMNAMYQEKTHSRNNPGANLDIIAMQLFGNPDEGYTKDFLHKKYKKLAVALHPDKRSGDSTGFNMLMTAYKHLLSKIHDDDVAIHTADRDEFRPGNQDVSPPPDILFESKFDSALFNDYYSKNHFKQENHGHGRWLKEANDIKIPERPSESNFNAAYESNKKEIYANITPKQLQLITQNGAPVDTIHETNYEMLGDGHEQPDYSGKTEKGVAYTDLRRAHETPHLLYDDTPTTKNVLVNDVAQRFAQAKQNIQGLPQKMTQAELDAYDTALRTSKDNEEMRRYRLRQQDENIEAHFKKTHHSQLTQDAF